MNIKNVASDANQPVRVKEALAALARGWIPTPLNGKTPTQKNWHNASIPDRETVTRWAKSGNIGIRTGSPSGIVVIDEDPQNGGDLSLFDLPQTVTAVSGGTAKGKHAYFLIPPNMEIRNSAGRLGTGIDVRGENGQIVSVGSLHPETGGRYRWLEGHAPSELKIAELPLEIAQRLLTQKKEGNHAVHPSCTTNPKYYKAALANECQAVSFAVQGQRNETLNTAAFKLGTIVGAGLLSREEVEVRLLTAASAHFSEDFTEQEAARTINSGLDSGIKEPRQVATDGSKKTSSRPRTDMGNAERLLDNFGIDLHYCFPWSKWLHFDGGQWTTDDTGKVQQLSKRTVRLIAKEASQEKEQTIREEIYKWARSCEKLASLENLMKLARSEPGVPILPEHLDKDPMLLNTNTGTLCLKNNCLRPHRREDLITQLAPVSFDSQVTCPNWLSFLERILPDATIRDYLQKALGYAITGDIRDHVIHLFVGCGANGKSTLVETILAVLGDYGQTAPSSLLLKSTGDRHPTELVTLHRKRVVFCSETPEDGQLNENLVKSLTGNDTISARRMREDFWKFSPTHKLFISTNHKPRITGTDHGIWRRLRLIPFEQVIPAAEQDHNLGKKLIQEAPGILNWLLEGCQRFQDEGLTPPESVIFATDNYRAEEDELSDFIADCLVQSESILFNKELTGCYRKWAKKNQVDTPLTDRVLTSRLTKRGYERSRNTAGRGIKGLALRE